MSLYYVLIVFLVVVLAFWLVWKYVPEPPKTVLLWILGIALVAWVLSLLGFWHWLSGATI